MYSCTSMYLGTAVYSCTHTKFSTIPRYGKIDLRDPPKWLFGPANPETLTSVARVCMRVHHYKSVSAKSTKCSLKITPRYVKK